MCLATLVPTLAACGGGLESRRADPAVDQARAAGTRTAPADVVELRGGPAAPGTTYLPTHLDATLEPGTVTMGAGPFSDRIELTGTSMRPAERPRASATLRNVADNSPLITMAVEVGFYDEQGDLVGSGKRQYGRGPAFDRKLLSLSVRSSRPAPKAVAAILVVDDLVNE